MGGSWGSLVAAAMMVAALAFGQPQDVAAEGPGKWGASVDFEGKLGTDRHLGEADLLMPLAQDERNLLFANLRMRLDDNESKEGNFGLGVRRMLGSGWNLGAYGYFDRRRTENDSLFNQLTFGAEALGEDWDFRVNSYWPVGDKVRDLSGGGGGASTASLVGTTIQVTTPGAIMREERALGGFDAEVGWRVPAFAAGGPLDLRLYAGGYRFDDAAVDTVAGPRLRAEFTAYEVPDLWDGARVTLGAEWQHDDVRGSQGFASLRLRIPLQSEARRPQRLTFQERRMTAPIVRDVDVVSGTRSATTAATVETATETSGGSAITVLTTDTSGDGNLTDELTAAGANSTVIVSGTVNTTGLSTMQAGQTLMGAGSLTVRAPSGCTATLTTPTATISGTVGSYLVRAAANATIRGLTLTNTSASSTRGIDVGAAGVTVTDTTVTATTTATNGNTAIAINVGAGGSATLSGNTFTAVGGGGFSGAIALSISGGSTVTVTGNTLGASGGRPARNEHTVLSSANINAGSTGNVVQSGTCADNGGNTGSIGFVGGGTCP